MERTQALSLSWTMTTMITTRPCRRPHLRPSLILTPHTPLLQRQLCFQRMREQQQLRSEAWLHDAA